MMVLGAKHALSTREQSLRKLNLNTTLMGMLVIYSSLTVCQTQGWELTGKAQFSPQDNPIKWVLYPFYKWENGKSEKSTVAAGRAGLEPDPSGLITNAMWSHFMLRARLWGWQERESDDPWLTGEETEAESLNNETTSSCLCGILCDKHQSGGNRKWYWGRPQKKMAFSLNQNSRAKAFPVPLSVVPCGHLP